jgi:Mn-containing catalase
VALEHPLDDVARALAAHHLVGDMFANVAAEATGRTLAVRLYNATRDPGMQDTRLPLA